MLNFAEQTGSGAVIVVWSFLSSGGPLSYITSCTWHIPSKSALTTALPTFIQSNNLTSYACKTHTTAHLVYTMGDFCHHCLINPPKNGQFFTVITQVSLNLHQFILFLCTWRLLSTLMVKNESKSNTNAAKQASFTRKGAFQETHHDAQSKNPFKNGQLFSLVTQTSLNVHQFILFLCAERAIKSNNETA